jgi:hypothetical protein
MRAKLLSAIGTCLTGIVLLGSTAYACTYGIVGTGSCQADGSYKILWTVNNTDTAVNQPLTIASSSNTAVVPVGTIIPADQSESFTQIASGKTAANFSLSIVGNWPSHELNETQTGTVSLGQACSQPTPIYTCSNLTLQSEDNRTVRLTDLSTNAQNGAVFTDAVIDWGDNTSPLTTTNVSGQTHQYAADGTYTIAATAHFSLNGKDVTATSQSCTQVVTISTPAPAPTPTPTPTAPAAVVTPPTTPTTLVNTGPGNVIGLTVAASIGGALAYNRFQRRKLSKTSN